MQARTSLSHPLRIDVVSCLPFARGKLGITFCPGKCGDSIHGAPWKRDLAADLLTITSWGASVALTLIEEHEFDLLSVHRLGDEFQKRGLRWFHLPIPDSHGPDERFSELWPPASVVALDALHSAGKVLVHCRGGLGRAGTVAAMLLVELGFDARRALDSVRKARPGAVETPAQERFVGAYVPGKYAGK